MTTAGLSYASGEEPTSALASLQRSLTVSLIATPRQLLKTCGLDDVAAIVAANNLDGFDYLPVTFSGERGDRIIGLFEAFAPSNLPRGARVRDHFKQLSEDTLVGSNAAIIDFIRTADSHGCRLLVSDTEICGLVTLSDLQRLPVRAALFAAVTQLEMTMAEAIRCEFADSDDWRSRLSENRRQRIEDEIERARVGDAFVDRLLYTQFADKRTIIARSRWLPGRREDFEKAMRAVEGLRNDLAHANDYASTREAALQLCATVRAIEHWTDAVSRYPTT